MVKETIIETAGRIWHLLGERGEVEVASLPKIFRIKGEVVYQGLGWLAREDKVAFSERKGRPAVSLVPHEKRAYEVLMKSRAACGGTKGPRG